MYLDPKRIGQLIKKYRMNKGLKQADLADKANVSTSYLGMLERGTQNFTLDVLEAIANALSIHPLDLLEAEFPDHEIISADQLSHLALKLPAIALSKIVATGFFSVNGLPAQAPEAVPLFENDLDTNAYLVTVDIDSLAPKIMKGDCLIVDPQAAVEEGDLVLTKLEEEDTAVLKEVSFDRHTVILLSPNASQKIVSLRKEDLNYMHKVRTIIRHMNGRNEE